jgi:hypothetical protein
MASPKIQWGASLPEKRAYALEELNRLVFTVNQIATMARLNPHTVYAVAKENGIDTKQRTKQLALVKRRYVLAAEIRRIDQQLQSPNFTKKEQ